ncbi:hypothetical protein K440DRAFT_179029 [Wilcoxina mikolae CBS 423.85]|nr:hypothetical protein K440DRAFT_179029 [Wilcoxina mikolae CBS 423.85]
MVRKRHVLLPSVFGVDLVENGGGLVWWVVWPMGGREVKWKGEGRGECWRPIFLLL